MGAKGCAKKTCRDIGGNMVVLITGASGGIGRATTIKFLNEGHQVIGIDTEQSCQLHDKYHHVVADVSDMNSLPEFAVNILINNAGIQTNTNRDVEVNLLGVMNCTEKYGLMPCVGSILNVASTSAHNGAEFPAYAASKGGVLAYTKHIAQVVADNGTTCNSISPGGVVNELNEHIIKDPELYTKVKKETLLNKWASNDEIAEWIYFMTVINRSMTGQDVIIDNGELSKFNFIW